MCTCDNHFRYSSSHGNVSVSSNAQAAPKSSYIIILQTSPFVYIEWLTDWLTGRCWHRDSEADSFWVCIASWPVALCTWTVCVFTFFFHLGSLLTYFTVLSRPILQKSPSRCALDWFPFRHHEIAQHKQTQRMRWRRSSRRKVLHTKNPLAGWLAGRPTYIIMCEDQRAWQTGPISQSW